MSRGVDERVGDVRRWLDAARAVHADRRRHAVPIAASTGLSLEGVELGFESLELDATPDELRALVASAGNASHVHVILSANVFVAPLRAIAIARAASARVTVRPSSRDPTLAEVLVAAAGDPAVSIAKGRDLAALEAERIDVYGRDDTIAEVRSLARPGVAVRGHGAGLGVALIARAAHDEDADAETPADADYVDALTAQAAALAADVIPFDQRGCLSPRVAFVEGTPARGEAFAGALHAQLASLGSRVPRGTLTSDERSEGARWRETLAFAGRVWVGPDHVVALAAPGMPLAIPPVGRHVLVVPAPSAASVRALVAPFARFVVTVGSNNPEALAGIAPLHARPALLGRMQRPPFDGPVDRRSF
jgi:Acyl-CoA reductase (LuxC)